MIKKFLIHLFLFITASNVFAQGSNISKEEVNNAVWSNVKDSAALEFTQLSSGGDFSGCELRYTYPYRDYRNRNGQPVIVVGSVTSYYKKGKAFSLFLKVQPQIIDLTGGKANVKVIDPKVATIKNGSINLRKFEYSKFRCETGGYCSGYSSSDMSFLETLFSVRVFTPTILFNFSQGGVDEKIELENLGEKQKSQLSIAEFNKCLSAILSYQIDELESQVK